MRFAIFVAQGNHFAICCYYVCLLSARILHKISSTLFHIMVNFIACSIDHLPYTIVVTCFTFHCVLFFHKRSLNVMFLVPRASSQPIQRFWSVLQPKHLSLRHIPSIIYLYNQDALNFHRQLFTPHCCFVMILRFTGDVFRQVSDLQFCNCQMLQDKSAVF